MPKPLKQEKLLTSESLDGVEIGDVDFTGHNFNKPVNFSGAIFKGKTVFAKTQFLEGANFSRTQFTDKDGVNFSEAQFTGAGEANFFCAQFTGTGGAVFSHVKFTGGGGANFNEAKFSSEGGVYFHQTNFGDGLIYFNAVELKHPEKVLFIDTQLRNASFLYTDIERVVFKNVTFRQTRNRFFNRECLADEVFNDLLKEEKKRTYDRGYYNQVNSLYRQLKLNFERQGDYPRAGDFHYGEMEMRRKAELEEKSEHPLYKKILFLKHFTGINGYKIISGYCERWQYALLCFLVLWFSFAGANIYWIEAKRPSENFPVKITYKDSIGFTLNTLTLQKDSFYRVKNNLCARLGVASQNLLGATVIALMLLAIRRKFKR